MKLLLTGMLVNLLAELDRILLCVLELFAELDALPLFALLGLVYLGLVACWYSTAAVMTAADTPTKPRSAESILLGFTN